MRIKTVINEEIQRLFEQQTYNISQLADVLKRMGFDEQIIYVLRDALIKAFRYGGDDEVIKIFKEITDVDIQALSRGKYMFANLYNPEKVEVGVNA